MAKKDPPKMLIGKPVKIVRKNPDNIRSMPINDVIISHTQHDFFITFSSIEPPSILEESDLNDLQEVEAIARAKFVISPEFAEAVLKALSINIEKFKEGKTDTDAKAA